MLLTTENPSQHHDRGLFEQLGIRAEQHMRGVGGQKMGDEEGCRL
jgi:hypothetical protein